MFVATHQLTKTYRTLCALSQCSLTVERGEVFGLLGPNGAGKTTLLRLLMGFLRPTSGTASIDGLDCYHQSVAVHSRVTYLPGDVRLFRTMRGRGVLEFFAHVRPGGDLSRSLELARRLDLDLSRLVAFMSTGMRQKLALAASLSADTPLVILDEPTSNLDPTVRSEVAALVREAKQAGRTIMFSSHVLSEVEDVCDRVAILRAGELVHTQGLKELRRRHRIHAELAGEMPAPPPALNGELQWRRAASGEVVIETPGELPPLLSWLSTLPVKEMRIEPLGLRAVYDQYHVAVAE